MQYLCRKQIVIGFILICLCTQLNAQRGEVFQPDHEYEKFWMGISIGGIKSFYDYDRNKAFIPKFISAKQVDSIFYNATPMFNMGLSATLRLKGRLLLRANPMLILGTPAIDKYYLKGDPTTVYSLYSNSSIIHVPVALKFESQRYDLFNNRDMMRHYVFIGSKFDYDFSNSTVTIKNNSNPGKGTISKTMLNKMDLGYELGLGLSFILRYATISPEVKFSYGVFDLKKPSTTTNGVPVILKSLDKVTSNYIYFTIHIEN